jgi:hypothetical protein
MRGEDSVFEAICQDAFPMVFQKSSRACYTLLQTITLLKSIPLWFALEWDSLVECSLSQRFQLETQRNEHQ